MAKGNRINKHTTPRVGKTSGIGKNKDQLNSHDSLIKFSYKYLDFNHGKFQFHDRDAGYFLHLFERMKDLSFKLVSELQSAGRDHKGVRFHDVDWNDTSEDCFGIPNEDMIVDKPWQFALSANELGRVHGFFINNVFYVVWFDPEHKLYSGKKK